MTKTENTQILPTVSMVVIALNEEKALPKLLQDMDVQTYPHDKIELLLVDGMSRDNTKKIMEEYAAKSDFARVFCGDNPKISLAAGWNVALREATGDVVIRLDAHASVPPDFVMKNVTCLQEGHDICGGKVKNFITDDTPWANTVNMAEDSMFGGSVAAFRHKDEAGYVNTLAFAAYKKEVFDKVGFFNESLLRTEDNEMHYRMRKAGYKFYYTPEIVSERETRPTFRKLLQQKYRNGYWVGLTTKICPQCFSLYHFVPLLFVLGILFTTVLCAFGIWQLAAVMWGLYAIVTVLMSVMAFVTSKKRSAFCLLLPFLFLLLHVGYGFGTLFGLVASLWKMKK